MHKEIEKNAIENISKTDLKDFLPDNAELGLLKSWNYILMFIFESKTSFSIMRKIFEKENYENIEEVILAQGMYRNFILSYSKCYSSSGKGRISLDASDIFKDNSKLEVIHKQILEIRNKHVAHNDESSFDIAINLISQNDKIVKLANTYTISTPINEFDAYLEALEYCELQVITKINEKLDKIEKRIGKKIELNK